MSRTLKQEDFPKRLLEIPQPPTELYIEGEFPREENLKFLAVVGSRKHTNYGKDACEKLIAGLKGYPIVIVSGLALGIDSVAHKTAMDNHLTTIAIPGSGLDRNIIHPQTNAELADRIVRNEGCLISEYEPKFRATQWSFPQRNRIMAGMCSAVLVIEAEEKSGTLITARMATDYNRDVLALPGSIFSKSSNGTNMLLRMGATPIRSSKDILEALGFEIKEDEQKVDDVDLTKEEKKMLDLLDEPLHKDDLIRESGFGTVEANIILSMMEIKGLIKETMGEIRRT